MSPAGNDALSPAGTIEQNCKKRLEWEPFPATVGDVDLLGSTEGPRESGLNPIVPQRYAGNRLASGVWFPWVGWAGFSKSRIRVSGITINALGVLE